ncbi:MAG: DUF5666 domain-containing protein [Desulfitobacteriaceae bacterium]
MKKPAKLAAVAVSSLLVLGLGNVAAFAGTLPAADPLARPSLVKPVPRPHVHGTIESVGSSLLTLKVEGQTVKVQLSASTVYERGPAQTLTLSDLKAGLEVNAEGAWDNGTFNALRVHLDSPQKDGLPHRPGKKPDGLGGIIQSVAGQSLTLKAPDGRTFTVNLTGSTKLHSGPQTNSTSALQAGKEVHIRLISGEQVPLPSTSSDNTLSNLTAADVDLVPPHWDGTITGGQGTSFTLATKDGQTVTLNLGSSTVIKYGPHSTSNQLTIGMKVHIEGTANGSTISPSKIDVHP